MARVYIGGIGGSGKTRVTRLLAERIEGVSTLTGSEIMMRAAGVSSREELRQLPEEQKERLRISVIPALYKSHDQLLAEGHYYLTREEIDCFDAFLLVEAPVERIVEFRRSDVTRVRSLEPEAVLRERQEMTERIKLLETRHGLQVVKIENGSTLDDLAEKVRSVYECSIRKEVGR